jgi:WD40 repeat protein
MRSQRNSDALLALLALTSLAVYILACRPSVSPDGSKVAFPVLDHRPDRSAAVIYDRNTRMLETVFESPSEDASVCSVQWLPDGKHIVLNGPKLIVTLPYGSPGATRTVALQEKLSEESLLLTPPIIGRYQFFTAESENKDPKQPRGSAQPVLLRVDLTTGETLKVAAPKECYLIGHGDKLFYARMIDQNRDKTYEIGTVDPSTLAQNPFLTLAQSEYGECSPFLAPAGDGARIALAAMLDEAPRIVILRGKSVEKVVPVAEKSSQMSLASLDWSTDGKTLYASFSRKVGDKRFQFGILEIPALSGAPREIPLFEGSEKDNLTGLQIALTPDGSQLITTSTAFDEETIRAEDRALYLIDIGSPSRKVNKVIVPPLPGANPGGKK